MTKSKMISTAVVSALLSTAVFCSCESKEKKVEDAQNKVEDAKQDLKDAKADLNAEYPAFRTDEEAKIADNQRQIDNLRAKLAKSAGTRPLDPARKKRIDELEEKNSELRSRLYGYEKERSDWQAFKRDFNRDMDDLANAFKDIGKDKDDTK